MMMEEKLYSSMIIARGFQINPTIAAPKINMIKVGILSRRTSQVGTILSQEL
jgi:hypothetical protein